MRPRRLRSPANLVHRRLLLRGGEERFGLAEPSEPDQGEDMVPERAPRFGEDGRPLAGAGSGGRDEEGQSLLHATGASEAPTEEGVHARTRSSGRLQARLCRVDHGPRAQSGGVEAQTPGQEFVAPGGMGLCREQRVNGCHVGRAVQEELMVEPEEGDLDALAGVRSQAGQAFDFRCGLLVSTAHVGRVGRQESRVETPTFVDGRPGHALGERIVTPFPGRLGSGDEEVRSPVPAGEAE